MKIKATREYMRNQILGGVPVSKKQIGDKTFDRTLHARKARNADARRTNQGILAATVVPYLSPRWTP
jgi:hypothetical protein